jgi:alpha-tubulin suppressor-like RCC1 family protein
VADTGELWVWGDDSECLILGTGLTPLGHGEQRRRLVPRLIEAWQDVKVDAMAAGCHHTLALADNVGVYAWGDAAAAGSGALGLGLVVEAAGNSGMSVHQPRRVTALRVTTAHSA